MADQIVSEEDNENVEWIDTCNVSRCHACGDELTTFGILVCLSCLDDEANVFLEESGVHERE